MAKMNILVQTAGVDKKMVPFFEGYTDEHISSCKHVVTKGIKATFEVESDLDPQATADHMKSAFKKGNKAAASLYFSIQPEGFFGKK